LLSAAQAALAANDAQSAPATINMHLDDFIPFLPISRFARRRAANALASCGHNACRCGPWQLAPSRVALVV
jgi:hypothetical protein